MRKVCSGVVSRMRIAEGGRCRRDAAVVREGRSSGSEMRSFAEEAWMAWESSVGV